MKHIKKFGDYQPINEFTAKAGIYPYFNGDNVEIEQIFANGEGESYILPATEQDLIEWFISKFGNDFSEDNFNPERGHYQTDYVLSDEEIIEEVKDKHLVQFCLDNKNKWEKSL